MDSLQELCLREIIDNFETFNSVYRTTENVTLKLKFEFLQRVYSFQIVTKLEEEGSVRDEYLDFVINKFLKTLDTDWLNKCSWDAAVNIISKIGSSLEKVTCGDEKSWGKIICHLTNLKFFSYMDYCDDSILCALAKFCPQIETIIVKFSTNVSNDGIKNLCQNQSGKTPCPALKELEICDTSVDNDGIKYLIQNLPSLEKIDYYRLPEVLYLIHKNNINDLGSVRPYNITNLILNRNSISPLQNDVFKVCFSLCPHLQSLSHLVFTQEHLDFCFQLSELKELHLDCLTESPLTINEFLKQKGNKLLSLTLEKFRVSVSTLILSCPRLISLVMDKVTYECNDNESTRLLHNLDKISFIRITMTDSAAAQAVIRLLSSSSNLKHLEITHCDMIPSDVKIQILKCCEHCTLENIDFSYSAVEFDFVKKVLLTCSSLIALNLNGCEISTDFARIEELETSSYTLPNKPLILYNDHFGNGFSDSEDFYNEFEDEDDDDYYYGDYFDYDFEDDDDNEDFISYSDM